MQARITGLNQALDHMLIEKAQPALESQKKVTGHFAIRNVHRTVGAMLGGRSRAVRLGRIAGGDDSLPLRDPVQVAFAKEMIFVLFKEGYTSSQPQPVKPSWRQ